MQDRSNTDMQFEQVRMRDFLSNPAQVSFTDYGLRLAAVMQRLSAHYHQHLGRWLAEHALIEPGLQAVLDRQAFDILAPDARHYLIRQLIKTVSGNSYHPRFSQIETLLTGLMQNKTLTCGVCVIQPAPSGYLYRQNGDGVRLKASVLLRISSSVLMVSGMLSLDVPGR